MSEEGTGHDHALDDRPCSADEPRTCAHCGADVPVDEWHPVETSTDDDGTFHLYAFCDESCKQAWTGP